MSLYGFSVTYFHPKTHTVYFLPNYYMSNNTYSLQLAKKLASLRLSNVVNALRGLLYLKIGYT